MPSSPQSAHQPLISARNRRSRLVLVSCLATVSAVLTFGLGVVFGQCRRNGGTWSVRVIWAKQGVRGITGGEEDGTGNGLLGDVYVNANANEVMKLGAKKHKVMAFVGILTGYDFGERRKSLRKTWMPSDQQSLRRLEESTGLAFRFVIGKTIDKAKADELRQEVLNYDDFMLLDIEEDSSKASYKTLAFFKAVYAFFDCEYYVKVTDDIYLRPDRLSLLLTKERQHPQTYIGCMKKGASSKDSRLTSSRSQKHLIGNQYYVHAHGSVFALSADIVANLVATRSNSLRMFTSDDVTIGVWMLAMNVSYEDNAKLCATECTSYCIADIDSPKCSGLCNPEERLLELHRQEICSRSPTYTRESLLKFLRWRNH